MRLTLLALFALVSGAGGAIPDSLPELQDPTTVYLAASTGVSCEPAPGDLLYGALGTSAYAAAGPASLATNVTAAGSLIWTTGSRSSFEDQAELPDRDADIYEQQEAYVEHDWAAFIADASSEAQVGDLDKLLLEARSIVYCRVGELAWETSSSECVVEARWVGAWEIMRRESRGNCDLTIG